MTEGLQAAITAAETLVAVEDLYRPYRPKRRTRATIAKEKGLEPLADLPFCRSSNRRRRRKRKRISPKKKE